MPVGISTTGSTPTSPLIFAPAQRPWSYAAEASEGQPITSPAA